MVILNALLSVVIGAVLAFLIYGLLSLVLERRRSKRKEKILPYAFISPALILVAIFMIYPTVRTFLTSFTREERGADGGEKFVGLENYVHLFSSPDFLNVILNNVLWIAIVPIVTVVVGLAIATLTDRLGRRSESVIKSIVFVPMAISAIAASVAWQFIYFYAPEGNPQVYLLNAVWTSVTGQPPVPWMSIDTLRLNSLLLMAIEVWLQAGFATVLLSAAVKGVPDELIEAARLDGASDRRLFFQVVLPQIRGAVLAVFVTLIMSVMKIFDIIYAMTGARFNTSVLAVDFYQQLFSFRESGRAAAVVVVLMVAVIPVIVYQIRSYREQGAI